MNPAIAFATTYFFNFVKLVCEAIENGGAMSLDGKPWQPTVGTSIRLEIVMPDNLATPVGQQMADLAARFQWRELRIAFDDRSRSTFLSQDSLMLLDLPTIIDTIRYTVSTEVGNAGRAGIEREGISEFGQETARLIAMDSVCSRHAKVREFAWLNTLR